MKSSLFMRERIVQSVSKLSVVMGVGVIYALTAVGGQALWVNEAQAQSTCTGGHINCVTFSKGKWTNQSSPDASTTVHIGDFVFPPVTTDYPVTSTNEVRKDTNSVRLTVPFGERPPASISIEATPTSNLVWNATHQGFMLASSAGGTNTQHVVLRFRLATTEQSCGTSVGRGGATISGRVQSQAGSSNGISYGMRVCMTAVIISQPPGNIILPPVRIFDLKFGGVAVGRINISGTPQSVIIPPPPPAPKTCDTYNGGDKVFPLSRIAVDRLENNASQGGSSHTVQLVNCPANINIQLSLSDVNNTNSTANYLVNQGGTATNAGVQLFYASEGTAKQMRSPWTIRTSVAGNQDLPFTARYYHITTNGRLGAGTVRSQAILQVSYP